MSAEQLESFSAVRITEEAVAGLGAIKHGISARLLQSGATPQEQAVHDVCYRNAAALGFEYVYVFKGTHDGRSRYKIGKAKSIEDRRKIFAVKLPFDIELAAAFYVQDAYKLESDLHRAHRALCVGGEWFDLDAAAFDSVCRIGMARETGDYAEVLLRAAEVSHPQEQMGDAAYIEHLEALLVMNGIRFDRRRCT